MKRGCWPRFACLLPVLLAGCQSSPGPLPPRVDSRVAPLPSATATSPDVHALTASRIELRLAPDGPLARLGHHHVIFTTAVVGTGSFDAARPAQVSFHARFAVDSLVVDAPEARAAAGGVYAAPLEAAAIAGTREHMLGETVLDAAHYPEISLRLVDWTPGLATVAFTVKGREHRLPVPVSVGPATDCVLAATGEAVGDQALTHAALGLVPYAALGGLLRVAEPIEVRFAFCFAP